MCCALQCALLSRQSGAALAVWQGGMAFHGGALGVILAVIYFARKNKIPLLSLGDMVAITGSLRAAVRTAGQFHQWRIMGPRH